MIHSFVKARRVRRVVVARSQSSPYLSRHGGCLAMQGETLYYTLALLCDTDMMY
jgi:hypothetical protein